MGVNDGSELKKGVNVATHPRHQDLVTAPPLNVIGENVL